MTDAQLYLALGIPILFNAAMFLMINKRFDDMRDVWRSELHRVEEIIDARLTRIEDHLHLK